MAEENKIVALVVEENKIAASAAEGNKIVASVAEGNKIVASVAEESRLAEEVVAGNNFDCPGRMEKGLYASYRRSSARERMAWALSGQR